MTERGDARLTGVGGLSLYAQWWRPEGPPRALIVLAHGAGEHSGRYQHVAERLVGDGYAVYALDHRGHGRSDGRRALIDRVDHAVADLDSLVSFACQRESQSAISILMIGHSMGGMLALRYALAHQQRLNGLALSGALASVDASRALRIVGHGISAVAPATPLIGIDATLVSRDPAVVQAYLDDPLVHHGKLPARTAAEIADTTDAFGEQVPEITLPALVMYGTADRLCAPAGSVMLGERLGGLTTVIPYPGLYHEIFNEPERELVLSDLCGWLDGRVAAPQTSV